MIFRVVRGRMAICRAAVLARTVGECRESRRWDVYFHGCVSTEMASLVIKLKSILLSS